MRTRSRKRRGISPIFSNILLILIIVLGMSFAFAFLTGYVTDFQLGQGSAIMELIEFEDVWFRSKTRIDVTLYNYGKADVKVLSVYLDGLQANFNNTNNDIFLTLAMGEHGSIRITPPHPLFVNTVYKLRIVTERGSAFDGQFNTPPSLNS
jgi:flagellin-like protein